MGNRSVRGEFSLEERRGRSVFLATRFNVVPPNDDDDFRSRSSISGKRLAEIAIEGGRFDGIGQFLAG